MHLIGGDLDLLRTAPYQRPSYDEDAPIGLDHTTLSPEAANFLSSISTMELPTLGWQREEAHNILHTWASAFACAPPPPPPFGLSPRHLIQASTMPSTLRSASELTPQSAAQSAAAISKAFVSLFHKKPPARSSLRNAYEFVRRTCAAGR